MVYQQTISDLIIRQSYERTHKDICVVVHNQLPFVRNCIESVMDQTEDYTLWVWDNGSEAETRSYLESLGEKINLVSCDENRGFIVPANELFERCKSDYVIMLNSDTKVFLGWDESLISQLQADPELGQVGYQGCLLDEHGMGGRVGSGYDIDYLAGWCFAVRRGEIEGPLFDSKNLVFAYGEDSDLSMRIREKGRKLYALNLEFVIHYENQTVLEVAKDDQMAANMTCWFEKNHEYIRSRWKEYLGRDRRDLQVVAAGL